MSQAARTTENGSFRLTEVGPQKLTGRIHTFQSTEEQEAGSEVGGSCLARLSLGCGTVKWVYTINFLSVGTM